MYYPCHFFLKQWLLISKSVLLFAQVFIFSSWSNPLYSVLLQLPEQYRYVNQAPQKKHKNKHKKHKHKAGESAGGAEVAGSTDIGTDAHEKKHKKQKRHDDDKERKKRKKEKKRKKQKHSPEHTGGGLTPSHHSSQWTCYFLKSI